ncbi:Fatty acyl-CoA reductase, partial [Gryllus bimaculatus]
TCTAEEPFPGWVDNFYGPTTILLANGIGALHSNCADPQVAMDIIPADYVVRGILLVALKLAKNRNSDTLPIYNATGHNRNLFPLAKIRDSTYTILSENRISRIYKWFAIIAPTLFLFRLTFILIDIPIALTLDCIAWWINQPTRMIKVQRRSIVAQLKNYYFSHHSFKFHHFNFSSLNDILRHKEKQRFELNIEHILWEPFMLCPQRELKKYFFPKNTINPGRIRTYSFYDMWNVIILSVEIFCNHTLDTIVIQHTAIFCTTSNHPTYLFNELTRKLFVVPGILLLKMVVYNKFVYFLARIDINMKQNSHRKQYSMMFVTNVQLKYSEMCFKQ